VRSTSGVRGSERRSYDLRHAVKIGRDVFVPEAQDAISRLFQKRRAGCVRFNIVLTAIGLDDEATFLADKIGDERADRLLPTEFQALELSRTEDFP
jgi:hypothetical protein